MQKINDKMARIKKVLLETTPLASVLIDIICKYRGMYSMIEEVNINAGLIIFAHDVKAQYVKWIGHNIITNQMNCARHHPHYMLEIVGDFYNKLLIFNSASFDQASFVHKLIFKYDKQLYFEYYCQVSYDIKDELIKNCDSGVYIYKNQPSELFYGMWIFNTVLDNTTVYVYYKQTPFKMQRDIDSTGRLTLPCVNMDNLFGRNTDATFDKIIYEKTTHNNITHENTSYVNTPYTKCNGCNNCQYKRTTTVNQDILKSIAFISDNNYYHLCNIIICDDLNKLLDVIDDADRERFYDFQERHI